MLKMNKKADIAITILVIGVIVLCVIALLSFYIVGEKQLSGGTTSVFYLQDVYNLAESVKYSGKALVGSYDDVEGSVEGFEIKKTYKNVKGEILIKITYVDGFDEP